MKKILQRIIPVIDILFSPLVLLSSLLLLGIRIAGVQRARLSLWIFRRVGVFPIRDHYYEPQFQPLASKKLWDEDRSLPGIDLNPEYQLETLRKFHFAEELLAIPQEASSTSRFYYNNDSFNSGDAEFLYNMIRLFKPRRIFEIGSGYSTLMAQEALQQNKTDDPVYSCKHVCIEPFPRPLLKDLEIELRRELVENFPVDYFSRLEENDILFIDSSHVIRPQGDVVFEYLEVLPSLKKGVLVHIHDIFTPKNYHEEWISKEVRFWNEQYLLEAFLTNNSSFRIIGAVNFLLHHFQADLLEKCPVLGKQLATRGEPGSFWLRKEK
jgi:predicted O-methyltransferase YrrM